MADCDEENSVQLSLTYSPDAYDSFLEAITVHAKRCLTVRLTMNDGTTFDAILAGMALDKEGIRYQRRIEVDGETFFTEAVRTVSIWSEKEPYLVECYVY